MSNRDDKDHKNEQLQRLQREHQEITPPPEIDMFIERGIQKGRQAKRKKKVFVSSLLSAAAVFLLMVGMIRVSPAFASALSDIPVLNKIVEMVRHDPNLQTAIEHDYIQPVDASAFAHGVLVDVEGIIIDGSRMAIFYSITDRGAEIDSLTMRSLEVVDEEGETLEALYGYWGEYDFSKSKTVRDKLEIHYSSETELPEKLFVKMAFEKGNGPGESYFTDTKEHPWELEIKLPLEEFAEKLISYDVHEYVEMEGQRIYFESVYIHPTQTEIVYRYDETNTHEIFGLEDLVLTDGKGKTWGRAANSISFTDETGRSVLFLDSVYFDKEPKELYLQGTRASALPKEHAKLKLDLETGEIVEGPAEVVNEHFNFSNRELTMEFNIDGLVYLDDHMRSFVSSMVLNEDGDVLDTTHASIGSSTSNPTFVYFSVKFSEDINEQYIYLPISYYPNYLEEKWEIKLK